MDPYRHMAVFAAVAETGSFTLAARQLGVAKSAVSRIVSELEREVGVSLLSRSTRRVALTEPGQVLFEGAARMVADAAEATLALRKFRSEPTGLLCVSAPHGLAPYVVAVLSELGDAHPRLRFDLRLESRYVNLLEDGVDVAVRAGAIGDSALMARTLAPVRYVICGAPAYFKAHGVPRTLADLARHEWIGYDRAPVHLAGKKGGRSHRVTVRGKWRAHEGDGMRGLLCASAGITLAPLWDVCDELDAGRLRVALADYEFRSATISALSLPAKFRLPKVVVFIQKLAAKMAHVRWSHIDPMWLAKSGKRTAAPE